MEEVLLILGPAMRDAAEQREQVSRVVRGLGGCELADGRKGISGLQFGCAADVRILSGRAYAAPGQYLTPEPTRRHSFAYCGGTEDHRRVSQRRATLRVAAPAQERQCFSG